MPLHSKLRGRNGRPPRIISSETGSQINRSGMENPALFLHGSEGLMHELVGLPREVSSDQTVTTMLPRLPPCSTSRWACAISASG